MCYAGLLSITQSVIPEETHGTSRYRSNSKCSRIKKLIIPQPFNCVLIFVTLILWPGIVSAEEEPDWEFFSEPPSTIEILQKGESFIENYLRAVTPQLRNFSSGRYKYWWNADKPIYVLPLVFEGMVNNVDNYTMMRLEEFEADIILSEISRITNYRYIQLPAMTYSSRADLEKIALEMIGKQYILVNFHRISDIYDQTKKSNTHILEEPIENHTFYFNNYDVNNLNQFIYFGNDDYSYVRNLRFSRDPVKYDFLFNSSCFANLYDKDGVLFLSVINIFDDFFYSFVNRNSEYELEFSPKECFREMLVKSFGLVSFPTSGFIPAYSGGQITETGEIYENGKFLGVSNRVVPLEEVSGLLRLHAEIGRSRICDGFAEMSYSELHDRVRDILDYTSFNRSEDNSNSNWTNKICLEALHYN